MTDLQAWLTGMCMGSLMRGDAKVMDIDVKPDTDEAGNYLPSFVVTGNQSGQRLRVSVEVI